jgi:hypothetical protein
MTTKPLCIDLYCGLGGWAQGFLAEGYRVIGFDIERHDYGTGTYPGQLVLQDVRTLDGSQFRDAAIIVASPPCQEYSYRAMPWKRAKALPPPSNELFEACFRIQREACHAAGRYIPMIVENVCGAQKWVGRAAWHFGSYYLWGDLPALMPFTKRSAKVPGLNWKVGSRTYDGRAFNTTAEQAIKGFAPRFYDTPWAWVSSRSRSRRAASAAIAKIPLPLSQWIARCYA